MSPSTTPYRLFNKWWLLMHRKQLMTGCDVTPWVHAVSSEAWVEHHIKRSFICAIMTCYHQCCSMWSKKLKQGCRWNPLKLIQDTVSLYLLSLHKWYFNILHYLFEEKDNFRLDYGLHIKLRSRYRPTSPRETFLKNRSHKASTVQTCFMLFSDSKRNC